MIAPRRRGFTLLEVILALSLTTFVLAAVAFAIDVHLRMLTAGRAKIEEGLLARALLEKIAGDLRNVVVKQPSDDNASQSAAGGSETPPSDDSGAAETENGAITPAEPTTPDSTTTEETTSESEIGLPRATPGLYGGVDWLQVDINRLPRLDQYQYDVLPTDSSGVTDRVSGVKTVAYYLSSSLGVMGSATDMAGGAAVTGDGSTGLMRRELDRAVTAFADQQGMLADQEQTMQPIAPEVSAVEFAYFDGAEWLDYWDMEEQGGLPVAVQISLTLTTATSGSTNSSYFGFLTGDTGTALESTTYSLVVGFPVPNPASQQQSTDMMEDMTGLPTDTNSGTSSPDGM